MRLTPQQRRILENYREVKISIVDDKNRYWLQGDAVTSSVVSLIKKKLLRTNISRSDYCIVPTRAGWGELI